MKSSMVYVIVDQKFDQRSGADVVEPCERVSMLVSGKIMGNFRAYLIGYDTHVLMIDVNFCGDHLQVWYHNTSNSPV